MSITTALFRSEEERDLEEPWLTRPPDQGLRCLPELRSVCELGERPREQELADLEKLVAKARADDD